MTTSNLADRSEREEVDLDLSIKRDGAGVVTLLVNGVEAPETDSADLEVEVATDEGEALVSAAAIDALVGRPRLRFTVGASRGAEASLAADPEPSAILGALLVCTILTVTEWWPNHQSGSQVKKEEEVLCVNAEMEKDDGSDASNSSQSAGRLQYHRDLNRSSTFKSSHGDTYPGSRVKTAVEALEVLVRAGKRSDGDGGRLPPKIMRKEMW